MTAKEYLGKIRLLDTRINKRLDDIAELREKSLNIKAVNTECEKVQGGKTSSDAGFVSCLTKISELEEQVKEEIEYFISEREKIVCQILELNNDKYIEILYKRYVEFKKLEVVADEMGYTYQYIVLLHGYALRSFYKKFQYKFNV